MRLLKISVLLCSTLTTLPALAQGGPSGEEKKPAEDPPVVRMENTSGGGAPQPVAPVQTAQPTPPPPSSPASGGGSGGGGTAKPASAPNGWQFDFHGYFRAPLRIGVGKRDNPLPGQSTTTLHAPVVPDDQYVSWQYSNHQARDWSEAFFSYGNSWAKGTIGILGFNFTDAAFSQLSSIFGIGQGWITLTPELPWENVHLETKVGSFWAKYGMAGRYDAGYYDTFLFGRTHVLGETTKMSIDIGDWTLWGEQGFGGKRPDPSIYNNARFTLLNHLHAGVSWKKTVDVTLNHMYAWAQEEDRDGATLTNVPNGSIGVLGADVRVDANMYGYLYAGYSHVSAKDARVVAPAVEVIHSYGGGEFSLGITDNYLDGPKHQSKGNGAVDTLLGQYEFSVANLMSNLKNPGTRYWGEGMDFRLSLFGMLNAITSDDPDMDGVKKMKFGVDAFAKLRSWFGIGLRADRLQPNSRIPEQSFAVLSPRIVFKSDWIAHEEITLQYSRYFYNQRECTDPTQPTLCVQPPPSAVLPDGFGATSTNQDPNTRGAPTTRPDLNVFRLQAAIWW